MVSAAVPDAFSVILWFAPPSTVYVTTALGVPVNVMVAGDPEQTVAVPDMVATGNGWTVTVTLPVNGCVQIGAVVVATLTSVMVVFDVYVLVSVAVPEAFSAMVWFAPPLTV